MKILFQIVMFSILGAVLFMECTEAESKTPVEKVVKVKSVGTVNAKKISYQPMIFGTGKLSSSEEIKLSFKTGGIIKRINVSEGQQVRKGAVLAELDLEEINAKTQQATLGVTSSKISIKNAELAVERAERELKNVRGLYQDSVATYEQLHDAELQLSNTKNQLEAAKTGLSVSEQNKNVAGFNLRYSKITAPSNGTILKKLAEANELTGVGTPIFLFGSKDKAKVIKVNLTDKDIIHVHLGDEALIEFDAYQDQQFKGRVVEVASLADPYTNTYEVEIEVDANAKNLLSGFIGQVKILTNAKQDLIEIPIDAFVGGEKNQATVFVLENGKAKKVLVDVYKIEADKLLVRDGLNGGETIVSKGAGYLNDGDEINVE